MRVHFIAIGGSAMHNLAIALHKKGYHVSGSDDEIFEPSKSRLAKYDLLPKKIGWNEEIISEELDAIILGMHARADNPELLKAQELELPIYSYPEYLYEQSKNKLRVVIAGSHGKTSMTSMVMHVLNSLKLDFDYMVGAQLEGFETMVSLSDAPIIILEGDEYLSSPIDRRPKFLWYKPQIAVISGIAWDHINVFPTFENYIEQFSLFIQSMEKGGKLFYFQEDTNLNSLASEANQLDTTAYRAHKHLIQDGQTILIHEEDKTPISIFGDHNLQNLNAAKHICLALGIKDKDFYKSISNFKGAAKRLELIAKNENTLIYKDYAHSPSKLKATVEATKKQYPNKQVIACLELHTFSSLNKNFLGEYNGSMHKADIGIVYYNPKTIEHKKLESISVDEVKEAFNAQELIILNQSDEVMWFLRNQDLKESVLLLMTSGNFDGINLNDFANKLIQN